MDTNLISFAGDGTGVIYLKEYGKDAVLLFTADQLGMREYRLGMVLKPAGVRISDLVKFSRITRFRLTIEVLDGREVDEDPFDCNECEDCEVIIGELYAATKYFSTIKGASQNIRLEVRRQHPDGKKFHDLGNFSDQGNEPTTGTRFNIATADASPVYVRCLSANRPLQENGAEQEYIVQARASHWFYPVFNFIKDILATFKIKI